MSTLAALAKLASGVKTFVAPHGVARAAGDSATVLAAGQGFHAAAPGTTFGQDLAAHTAIGAAASAAWGKGGVKARLPGAAIGGLIGAGLTIGKEAYKQAGSKAEAAGKPLISGSETASAPVKAAGSGQQAAEKRPVPKRQRSAEPQASGDGTYQRTYTTGRKAGITETVTRKPG